MQYQVFVQSQPDTTFLASIVGIPNCTAVGSTQADAVSKAKEALKHQLAQGELVTIDLDDRPINNHPWLKHMGIFADDPTFDDFMAEVAAYRYQIDEQE